jgi:hypothetical protein
MPTDDEFLEAIRRMIREEIAGALEGFGFVKPPSLAALRTRRYRERKAASPEPVQIVTAPGQKRHKTSQAVTKRHNGVAKDESPTNATWNAYAAAYIQRYGVEPTRNGQVNGLIANFLARVPAADAPAIAAFYVRHNKRFYLSCRHSIRALLRDAEGLRTEWLSGRAMTETEAHQADRTAALGNVFNELKDEIKYGRH